MQEKVITKETHEINQPAHTMTTENTVAIPVTMGSTVEGEIKAQQGVVKESVTKETVKEK